MQMSKFLALAIVATSIAQSYAACHNNCNGHGTCGANDVCTCYAAWAHSATTDCSNRICPYGTTRGTVGTSVHNYQECSDNGVCNRKTGECECQDGYTGKACQRTACPNDCSGRGDCQLLKTHNSAYDSTAWDRDTTMICSCDPGYSGSDCSQRDCPLGDDPLTTTGVNEVQRVSLTTGGGNTLAGQFTLKFTDWTGQVHETWPLTSTTVNALAVQEALAALPNNVIPSVTATVTNDAAGTAGVLIDVTFSHADNSGPQTLLGVGYLTASGDGVAGSVPTYTVLSTGGTLAVAVTKTTTGTKEAATCSGRGVCDTETGLCTCYQGFYGQNCDKQTSLQ